MAEACSIAEYNTGAVRKIVWTWTSAADGSVGAVATTTNGAYDGRLIVLQTAPGLAAPAALYNVYLLDADGLDVLAGAGTLRPTAIAWKRATTIAAVAGSTLRLTIDSAGNSKNGTVTLWLR